MKYVATLLLLASLNAGAGTLYAFGDSITVGYSASAGQSFITKVAQAKGLTLDNRAYNGHQVADTADRIYSLAVQPDTLSAWLAGFNDYRYFGSSPTGHETYRAGVMALAAWLAIPESGKVRASNATASAGWSPTSVYGGIGRYSSAKGSTLTFQLSGTVVYVAGISMVNPVGGIFGVTVDGKPTAVGNCYGSALTYSGIGYSPFLVRIDGLRPGPHEVVVTVQSSSGTVFVDWAAGNGARGPTLYLGGPLRIVEYSRPTNPEFGNGSDALVQKYSETTREIARMLTADGLDVVFVDANSRYRPEDGDEDYPDVHPNDRGHAHIAQAFLEKM